MISSRDEGQTCVFKVDSVKFDSAVGAVLRNAIASRLETNRQFVLDMAEVKLVDSGGLGALVAVLKNAKKNEAKFALVNLQKSVKLMLELSRMDRQFDIHPDLQTAIEKLN